MTITYRNSQNYASKVEQRAYRYGHKLLDILDLVSARRGSQALELGRRFGRRSQTLRRRLLFVNRIVLAKNYLVLFIVLIEEGLLIMNGTRRDLHPSSVLLSVALHFLQMLVVAVFRKPSDDIPLGPVDLEGMRVLIVDMVLLNQDK